MMADKFFYKFIFILANETKDHNRVYKKHLFMYLLGFLGEKLILDYVKNTKMSNFASKLIFRKIFILEQMQICSQKGIKNFLSQVFVFVYEKNAYHTIFIHENFMISFF